MQEKSEYRLYDSSSPLREGQRGEQRGATLIAPLNWGLGHASRCVPIVRQLLAEGNRVTLAGDGESLALLRTHFPDLPVLHLPKLNLRYSKGTSQVGMIFRSLPHILHWMWQDHRTLQQILSYQHFDVVISDNRFGLWGGRKKKDEVRSTKHIYITHQLMVKMPKGWRWAEPIAHWLHSRIIRKYNECWIPDYAGDGQRTAYAKDKEQRTLSGDLAHKYPLPKNARFIGPLSRFSCIGLPSCGGDGRGTVALLSGLEPHRTLLEKELLEQYQDQELLLIRGKVNEPFCKIQRGKITIVPHLSDAELVPALLSAEKIIARSGYSTIMDFAALGVLHKAELIPTPGQTEQEYLAEWIIKK